MPPLSRRIYEALRTRETVSGAELADIAMHDKGIDDAGVRATFVARFLVRLDQMALRGDVWSGSATATVSAGA
ncbi:MAG TPA: hypothetical protein VME41_14100 [Stellaceae bacterium]|nr:hypothetical protein [Stellaceae bacterium]